MSFSRSAVALVSVGILGLAGVGVGANADWRDSVTISQSISAGSVSLAVSSSADGALASGNGKTLTLAGVGLVKSTFKTVPATIVITNNGTLPAKIEGVTIDAITTDAQGNSLRDSIFVEFGFGETTTSYRLANLVGGGLPFGQTLDANTSLTFTLSFFADDLPVEAERGVVTPVLTITGSEV